MKSTKRFTFVENENEAEDDMELDGGMDLYGDDKDDDDMGGAYTMAERIRILRILSLRNLNLTRTKLSLTLHLSQLKLFKKL